uniref:Uncharacterized protein n=1 Tax=Arundo donax TaxID=35708 RepID=A0A0A9A059_ARUDO
MNYKGKTTLVRLQFKSHTLVFGFWLLNEATLQNLGYRTQKLEPELGQTGLPVFKTTIVKIVSY